MLTDFSEEHAASIFRIGRQASNQKDVGSFICHLLVCYSASLILDPEDGDSTSLQNVDILLTICFTLLNEVLFVVITIRPSNSKSHVLIV
jgi:hypothetical protein